MGVCGVEKNTLCFPVVTQDAVNYLIDKYLAKSQISCIFKLNGKLNQTILQQAVRLSLDAEPILGCRFIEDDDRPFWELRKNLETTNFFSIIETSNLDEELQRFVGVRNDLSGDCQIKVILIRTEVDTVCIKVNHACSDAAGLKQYLRLLTLIYNQLIKGLQYIAESKTSVNRGQDQIFSIDYVANAVKELMKTGVDQSEPTVAFPCKLGEENEQAFLVKKYSVKEIAEYARVNYATVNDVLLTAFIRSLPKVADIQNNTISLYFTIDLRRYLADRKAGTICNLSAMQVVTLKHNLAESFDETLSHLLMETRRIKNNYPGIKSSYLLEMAHRKLRFKDACIHFQQRRNYAVTTGLCIPTLSNVGVITEKATKFGSLEIVDCYMVGPAAFSPNLGIVASTFNDTLTFTVNFFQSTMPRVIIEKLLDGLCNELQSYISRVEKSI